MWRDRADFGGMLKITIGRYAIGDGEIPKLAEHRQLLQIITVTDFHATMLCQQHTQHFSILPRDLVSQLGKNTGGHSQIDPDAVHMPRTGAATGHQDDLVLLFCLDQDIQYGENGFASAINDALAADLKYIDIRLHAEIFFGLGSLEKLFTDEGLSHKGCINVKPSFLALFFDQLRHHSKAFPKNQGFQVR